MKLQTSIPPRRDGTLNVTGLDGQTYAFAKGEDGELVGDVTDEATVAHLLAGGMFFPADPADFDAALELTKVPGDDDEQDGEGQASGDDQGDEDGDDEQGDMNAMPVEAATPPAPKRNARKAK